MIEVNIFSIKTEINRIASLLKVRIVVHTMHLRRIPLQTVRKGLRIQCQSNIDTGVCASLV